MPVAYAVIVVLRLPPSGSETGTLRVTSPLPIVAALGVVYRPAGVGQ